MFREFGIVVAGAVLISAFVSLTLTPVLNVKLTKKVHKHSWFYTKTEPFFHGMESGYNRALRGFMKVRWLAFVIIAVAAWAWSASAMSGALILVLSALGFALFWFRRQGA